MVRKIKFRAWDIENKKMINNAVVANGHYMQTYPDMDIKEDFPLMQDTGLTDKNGTEIYEGDIVSYRGTIEQPGGVLIREQVGVIKIDKGMTGFQGITKQTHKGEVRTHESKTLLLSPEIYEVIGNIHDSPELLEVEE